MNHTISPAYMSFISDIETTLEKHGGGIVSRHNHDRLIVLNVKYVNEKGVEKSTQLIIDKKEQISGHVILFSEQLKFKIELSERTKAYMNPAHIPFVSAPALG